MIIAAMLLMQAAPVAEAASCRIMRGGIGEGMCIGSVDPDAGGVLVSLLPAPEAGPPIASDMARTIDRLLKVHGSEKPDLPAALLAKGATSRFCTDWTEQCMVASPLTGWPLPAFYTPGRPYLLPDGRVRIEWMLGVKLDYISLITFDGKKVRSIDTTPSTIPLAKAPRSR